MSAFNGHGADDDGPSDPRGGGARASGTRPVWRRGRRPWVPLGLLVLLFVLIAVVPRNTLHSRTLPPGRWGAALHCLERKTSFRVTAFGTGVAPERATRTAAVQTNLGHHTIAELQLASSAAAAQAVVRGNRFGELARSDYHTDGSIVWAYVQSDGTFLANAGERALIDACVRAPNG